MGNAAVVAAWRGLVLAFLALVLLPALALPTSAGDKPPEAFGEVTFEMPEGGAYAQEMITMVVRFYFKVRATTENMKQPDLEELGWAQLGRDVWAPTKIGTANWFGVTRRIAVFAPEAKTYEIPPFIHHVTLIDAQGIRWKVDAVSKPVKLTIKPWTGRTDGPDDEGTWWLPAKSVTIEDSWSIDPGTLDAGQITRRRLSVTAVGTLAEQLPPMIETQSPGLVVFPGPVERRTEIVEGVPVAHAIYSYDIRPHTGDPTILREVLVPWFDTEARAMRQSIVPGASVGKGMVIPGQPVDDTRQVETGPSKTVLAIGAGLAAFVFGVAALLLPGRRDRLPVALRVGGFLSRLKRTLAVRKAALFGKPEPLRAAIYGLAREDGAAGREWLADPAVRDVMAALDRALFGLASANDVPAGTRAAIDLKLVASTILKRRAACLKARAAIPDPIGGGLSPFGN